MVELTVVTAIISILAGLSVPAMQKARRSANATGCLNNFKQMALASQVFAAENLSRFPGFAATVAVPNTYYSWTRQLNFAVFQSNNVIPGMSEEMLGVEGRPPYKFQCRDFRYFVNIGKEVGDETMTFNPFTINGTVTGSGEGTGGLQVVTTTDGKTEILTRFVAYPQEMDGSPTTIWTLGRKIMDISILRNRFCFMRLLLATFQRG